MKSNGSDSHGSSLSSRKLTKKASFDRTTEMRSSGFKKNKDLSEASVDKFREIDTSAEKDKTPDIQMDVSPTKVIHERSERDEDDISRR